MSNHLDLSPGIQEQIVTFDSAFKLEGTLALPGDAARSGSLRLPAILIVPGTGKNDRDGNSRLLRMNLYRDLARALTALGFLTLRYDKRGTGNSGGNFEMAGLWDLIADAEAAVRFLRKHPAVDPERVIILGHSEGAMIAPAVNAQCPVDGLMLISGTSDRLIQDILPQQQETAYRELNAMKGFKGWLIRLLNVVEKAKKQNERLEQAIAATDSPTVRFKGKNVNAKWWREHADFRVTDYLPGVRCPAIVVSGAYDIQTKPEQARTVAELIPSEAEWHIIPRMSHVLRKSERPVAILDIMKEYKKQLKEPIDAEFMETVGKWLNKHFEPKRS